MRVVPDARAVGEALAEMVLAAARECTTTRGRFVVALSGGETPRRAYELLGSERRGDVDWTTAEVFFTDERFVPPDDARNNASMAMNAWLSKVEIPPSQIHPIPTVGVAEPVASADAYERTLRTTFGADVGPTFDLAIMGIGTDGHTASLFPADRAAIAERRRWVLAVHAPHGTEPRDRVTLTLPVLNRSRRVVFVATGAAKRAPVAAALSGQDLPAAMVHGQDSTEWLLDAAAS